jgi:hypothetical protein
MEFSKFELFTVLRFTLLSFFYTLLDPSSNPQKVTYSGEDEANHIDQSGQLVDSIILVT